MFEVAQDTILITRGGNDFRFNYPREGKDSVLLDAKTLLILVKVEQANRKHTKVSLPVKLPNNEVIFLSAGNWPNKNEIVL